MDFLTTFSDYLKAFVFYSIEVDGAQVPLIVLWLLVASAFFTLYFKFINIRGFKQAFKLVRGDYDSPDDKSKGEVSHFQALTTALSGTVGLGNIGGVAAAISIGGPGACFWLPFAGFLAMSTKFVECALGVKYREYNDDGSVSGGPMYYLKHGLAEQGMPKFGLFLGYFYALCIIIGCVGIGNMFQANQAYSQFNEVFMGGESSVSSSITFGVILAILTGCVIIGGIKSIAKVTSKLVPFMCGFYVVISLLIIGMNIAKVPEVIGLIFSNAFSPEGVQGGLVGVIIIGFRRALFSNEAGIGSAATAHAAVKTDEPVTEGLVAALEPFVDTIVICMITSFVILLTVYDPAMLSGDKVNGIRLTSDAFGSAFSVGPYFLSLAAILFAISTMISWSYYGLKGFNFIFGEGKSKENIFKVLFCIFVVVGCASSLDTIIDISDALIFLIAFPNILGLYILAPRVKQELADYFAKVKSGEIVDYRKKRAE